MNMSMNTEHGTWQHEGLKTEYNAIRGNTLGKIPGEMWRRRRRRQQQQQQQVTRKSMGEPHLEGSSAQPTSSQPAL